MTGVQTCALPISIIDTESEFIDCEKLNSHKSVLDARIALNKQRITEKDKESSKVVSLESIESILDLVKEMVEQANKRIKTHNETVDNLASEKSTLTDQIWKYIVNEANAEYAAYSTEKSDLEKAITGLNRSITEKQRER